MLTKYKLVNTDGLKGLFIKGRLIPFDKIDDTMAVQLTGRPHMLERLPEGEPAPQLALPAAAAEEPAAATATTRRRTSIWH